MGGKGRHCPDGDNWCGGGWACNITARGKVKESKELTRCIMAVGVVDKFRFNGCKLGSTLLEMVQSRGRMHSLNQRSDNL